VIETIHVRKIGAIWFAWPKTPAGTQAAIAHDDERLDAVGKLIDRMLARGFVLADSVGITTDEPSTSPPTQHRYAEALNPRAAERGRGGERARGRLVRAARCVVDELLEFLKWGRVL
jgi:hypothetical protein